MVSGWSDPEIAATFARDGYVVVPLLDAPDVAAAAAVYAELERGDGPGEGFNAALRGRTLDENLAIDQRLRAVLAPALAAVLPGYSLIGSTFLAKGAGRDGEMTVHQDWCCVDERVSHSVNAWVALADVEPDMGPLEVIPGSHLWFDSVRSPTIDSVQIDFGGAVDELLVPLAVRAGSAIVYDHRLLHGSRENRSGRLRVAAQLGLSPSDEPLVTYYEHGDGRVELRRVDATTFFRGLDPAAPPGAARPGELVELLDLPAVTPGSVVGRIEREARRRRGEFEGDAATSGAQANGAQANGASANGAQAGTGRLRRLVRSICSR